MAQFQRGTTIPETGIESATQLHNLIEQALALPGLIDDQPTAAAANEDRALILTSAGLRKTTVRALRDKSVVQVVDGFDFASGNYYEAAIPFDATVPTQSEGVQIASAMITLRDAANHVVFHKDVVIGGHPAGDTGVCFAFFRNATCIATRIRYVRQLQAETVAMEFMDQPGNIASNTYTIRVGKLGTYGFYVDAHHSVPGVFGSTFLGGRATRIEEVKFG